jgi:hypothetical protein
MSFNESRAEEFSTGMRYAEPIHKCFCCGRLIPSEPVVAKMHGLDREFCSEDCVSVYNTYRLPYWREGTGEP